jgi:4-amino-4-deoxy-L-arabinose transferase-like glycosyltransferase
VRASRIYRYLAVAIALTVLLARALTALGTPDVLDWDETYYASTTATAAHGFGLYPYVLGYPQIPNMGGVGFVIYLYVLAYNLIGPQLIALRVVSVLASLAGVAGIAYWTKKIYGGAAGFAALAIAPALLVFQLSNSIRFDILAIAFVAWALVLHAHAATRPESLRWSLLVGFVFALGLEVHLHTAAAAFAVGFAHLIHAVAARRRSREDGSRAGKVLLAFVGGYSAGALLFVALNVLPDSHAFVRTAGLARLSAVGSATQLNLTAPMDPSQLAKTFVSPGVIASKEIDRYRSMFREMRRWEAALWLLGFPAFFLFRRPAPDLGGRALVVGAAIGGGIVFNSASPLYFSAILPFVVPVLATVVSHGFSRKTEVLSDDVSGPSVVMLAILAVAILPAPVSATLSRVRHPEAAPPAPAIVDVVKHAAPPNCIVAGQTDLYARYFMSYPKFVGTRPTEVLIGSTYYDLQNDLVAYWRKKDPDIVFGKIDAPLEAFLRDAKYTAAGAGVWRKPGGCQ